jgi:hypothetical protein
MLKAQSTPRGERDRVTQRFKIPRARSTAPAGKAAGVKERNIVQDAGARPGDDPAHMTVAEFDTKIAIVVRDDLAAWQRLNVTAFLVSGLVASAGATVTGEDYVDGDGARYLPLLVQPVLVFETGGEKLRTLRERAARREVPVAIYTADMFATGNDADNRAAVRAVGTAQLNLVGLGVRAGHRDVDAIVRGAQRHP